MVAGGIVNRNASELVELALLPAILLDQGRATAIPAPKLATTSDVLCPIPTACLSLLLSMPRSLLSLRSNRHISRPKKT